VGSHLLAGRLNPETLDAEWVANRRHRDLAPVLEAASVRDDPGAVLEDLLPTDAAYAMLVDELARLRRIRDAGGWPTLTTGPSLRLADEGPRIAELVDRLRLSGDFDGPTSAVFASSLEGAVKQFQHSHGLLADGIVGTATLQALNTPVEARIDQVIANLERWRWLPEELGEFYVVVNIASFRLDVVRDGQSVLDMRIVVGTPYRRTPVFSDQIRYLVLNPYWEVPNRIAIQDKLPLIKRNPNYLAEQSFTVLQGWGTAERIIDPATVNWASLSQQNFPYRLRQSPGPFNALGRVKFMFPNRFSVYLHDTPARELFDRETRTFSSGCIRLEAPLELAETVLSGDPKWSRAAINAASRAGREQTIQLPTPVPVHLQYWTAWIRRTDGKLQFSNDVYGRDQTVLRALREAAPT
jgi:murein L,D-transpeptidase YcbB/YkuD